MVSLLNVSLSFDNGKSYVLKNVTMNIFDNEILAIIGGSGAGKSSLLKIIIGLIPLYSGVVTIDGVDIKKIKSNQLHKLFGYVFQDICLFPHMTVAENISIALRLENKNKSMQLKKATELLQLMNFNSSEYLNRYPDELSGGEQQRIGIARALAADPKYLFMDEPFSAIDPIMCAELHYQIFHLQERLNKTIVFITHNVHEALRLADRIAVFSDGHLAQIDEANKVLTQPVNNYVKKIFTICDPYLKERKK